MNDPDSPNTSPDEYGLSPTKQVRQIPPPAVDYQPQWPTAYRPKIALVGAGGISEFHLRSYRDAELDVAAICSRKLADAKRRRDEFYPEADVCEDYHQLLGRDDIEIVDLTPHPDDRLPLIEAFLNAKKHVLSQKPFVHRLDDGERLVRLAKKNGVQLAVNQNGRWAPHFSYLRTAVANGLIGDVTSVDFQLQWDQTWIAGTEAFESIHHLILFDFGVHWFDITSAIMGDAQPDTVYAAASRFPDQVYRPPAIASAVVQYPNAQVRLSFHGHATLGEEDVTTVVGSRGTLRSRGPGLNEQPAVEVFLPEGQCTAPLDGCWFESGFAGTMGELLCAIEQRREPLHSAENNLKSLELCFAALKSANEGRVVRVGESRAYEG